MEKNRRSILILFFTMVVVMMGFGIVIPILPFYIESMNASGSALGLLMAVYAVMQFLFSPIWGDLSDRYGRRPILIIGVIGNALGQLLFGLSTELWMLFAARALAGMLSSATLPTAMAFIGDSTTDDNRSSGMGIIGAAMGVGMVLGPGLGGWLAESSLALPFFVSAGLSLLALLPIALFLPESLPVASRNKENKRLRGPQLGEMWRAIQSPIGFLLVLAFLLSFGLTNFEGVFGIYAMDRYGYGPQRVGLILTFIGIVSAIMQGMLTGPLSRRWGEHAIVKISLLGSAIGFLLMLQARNLTGVIVTVSLFIISNSLLRPTVSSLTSQRATVGQGVAMGLNNAFMSLGRIFGPALAGFLFDLNMGLPYQAGAIVMLIGFLASLLWMGKPTPLAQEGKAASRAA